VRSTRTRWLRRGAAALGSAGIAAGVALLGSVVWVRAAASGHTYADRDLAHVPPAPVALVLGAQVYPSGTPSPFLAGRLDLAKRLYDAGLVEVVLVSGDNMAREYNEPDAMRDYLLDAGVPADKVVADYAGFDTYDSCARAERIFGVRRATVVTQTFHLPRAVALCRRLGIDANGVGDDSAKRYAQTWWFSSSRENGACLKAALDLLSGRDPAHLGRRETGVDDALRVD
jgi:vancomycin permeability regulator SanA